MGERLHKILGQIGSKLWFPWQQKLPIDLKWGKQCLHFLSVVFDLILFILARNEDMHKISDRANSFIFDRIFVKLAGNQDSHKISDEFKFWPDRISHLGVTCPCGRIKFSIDILWNLQVQLTFQTLEFFVTLFSGTVRPRRLKHGTYVGRCIMYTGIRLLLLICPFIFFSFFFLSNFQH